LLKGAAGIAASAPSTAPLLSQRARAADKKVLRIAMNAEVLSLDPIKTAYGADIVTQGTMYARLRDWKLHPGTRACFWNTPFGTGCVWGNATDANTVALRHGGVINSVDNHGAVVWISQSASDPTATFTGTGPDYDGPRNSGGTHFSVTAHVPAGAYAPGPYPGDNQFCFIDATGNPGKYWHFSPLQITNFQGGGPYNAYFAFSGDATTDLFASDYEMGGVGAGLQTAGLIRGYDLDPNQNPARIPGTNLPAIQHVLRYMHDSAYFKANANTSNSDYPNGVLAANAWPEIYQDFQSGINVYTGNLPYGTTVGIPQTMQMPAGLTDAGKQIFYALQTYGAVPRDQAGGGFHLSADQTVSSTWLQQANNDLPKIVKLLCPLRNQHQAGQNFADHPPQGPGPRVDPGPAPLALISGFPTPSTNGAAVTTTAGVITDSFGNTWTLTTTAQVAVNRVTDSTTLNVAEIRYVNGIIWHKNTSNNWYCKSAPWNSWAGPTSTDPTQAATANLYPGQSLNYSLSSESPDQTVVTPGSGTITDANGSTWSINSAGQIVKDGTVDPTIANVVELAYVNHTIWQENSADLWWSWNGTSWQPTNGRPSIR
jgi:hypothetical protein